MTPFFRRIRHKLANDNQFLKYSRYAIGEIILVVIGILIALQINNWNEERQLKKSVDVYLNRLVEDLNNEHIIYHMPINKELCHNILNEVGKIVAE